MSEDELRKLAAQLQVTTWRWGESCGIDDLHVMSMKGDSYNEGLRAESNHLLAALRGRGIKAEAESAVKHLLTLEHSVKYASAGTAHDQL